VNLYCCECAAKVTARLTNGAEIYPRRADLADIPFWKCDACGNHVGCHHKTADRTRPLGCIPNDDVRNARQHIHALIDPAWKSGTVKRAAIYRHLSERTGRQYHTAHIRSVEEARAIYLIARDFIRSNCGQSADNENGPGDDPGP
jgi:hypothetical protein